MVLDGPMNAKAFHAYIEEVLAPTLKHAVVRGAALPGPIRDGRAGNPDQGEQLWKYTSDLMSR